jgi:hypothetical protein
LHGNVQAFDVERLEENLGGLFAILRRVKRRFGLRAISIMFTESSNFTYEEEIMIFGLCSQVLEDRLLPIPLHVVPVIDHTVPDGIMNTVTGGFCIGKCLITNKEVKIFNATLGR